MDENQTNCELKCVRLENGGDFSSNELNIFCEEQGIRRQTIIYKTPQQNGVFEEINRLGQQHERAIMDDRNMPKIFWVEFIHISLPIF